MESTPLTTPLKTTANPASFVMDRQKKPEPHAPAFMQALAQATQPFVSQTLNAESANLARPAEPPFAPATDQSEPGADPLRAGASCLRAYRRVEACALHRW